MTTTSRSPAAWSAAATCDERVRVPHGDEHVAGPGLDLPDGEIRRRQQLERVHVVDAGVRLRVLRAERQRSTSAPTSAHGAQSPARRRWRSERQKRRGSARDDEHEARGNPQAAERAG